VSADSIKQGLLDAGYSLHITLDRDRAIVVLSRGNTCAYMPFYGETEIDALRAAEARVSIAFIDRMNGLKTYGNAVDD
jgi:hypothetical protein